ncbi:MAG: hypothetical protein PF569_06880 [Candidatus Woesearchaeota archaeon]|jgi:hypothetical protein|nr:hypothetical protein [Candidatus Woesearchaeota archaeon]
MDNVSKEEFTDFVLTIGSHIMSLRTEITELKQKIQNKENGNKKD